MFTNRWIILGVTVQAIAQLAITYLPAMNTVFGTAPIGVGAWLRILAIAAAASVVVAIDKRLRRLRESGSAQPIHDVVIAGGEPPRRTLHHKE